MQAQQWPNGLGWSVRVCYGLAEVEEAGRAYVVTVPVAPTFTQPFEGSTRTVRVNRFRVCRVPAGTDPVEAVRLCVVAGALRLSDGSAEDTVPFLNAAACACDGCAAAAE